MLLCENRASRAALRRLRHSRVNPQALPPNPDQFEGDAVMRRKPCSISGFAGSAMSKHAFATSLCRRQRFRAVA
jgi:hypothetical protein